jgi:hypothetical protein
VTYLLTPVNKSKERINIMETTNQVVNFNIPSMVDAVRKAVSGDILTVNKWENAGIEVAKVYPSAKSLDEVKAQFVVDCIIPALPNKYVVALALDLPRKGSKAHNELVSKDGGYMAKWEMANQAKKDARSIAGTYYNRVKSYAFPEKKTSEKKDFLAKISALIVEGGKITECNFDLPKVMGFLIQAEQAGKQGLAK